MNTLDEFQKEMNEISKEFKARMQKLLVSGIEAKLDEDIMIAIIQKQITTVMSEE